MMNDACIEAQLCCCAKFSSLKFCRSMIGQMQRPVKIGSKKMDAAGYEARAVKNIFRYMYGARLSQKIVAIALIHKLFSIAWIYTPSSPTS